MNNSSFQKGEEFEDFVEKTLFDISKYDLIYRTNNFEQNNQRYSEDSKKPDFKFRCKYTGKQFYVEAKFRSRFNSNKKLEILNYQQKKRFIKIQEEEKIPIFIVIGYQGTPSSPKNLSLIPLNDLNYLQLYFSQLKDREISHKSVDNKFLEPINIDSKTNSVLNLIKEYPKRKIQNKFILIVLFLILISIFSFNYFINSEEEIIKEKLTEYYRVIEKGDIESFDDYVAPKVNKWYNKRDLTLREIKAQAKDYIEQYPNTSTEIKWDTFELKEIGDEYLSTYELIYKIINKNSRSDIYHLRIKAYWNKDLKINSIVEERL